MKPKAFGSFVLVDQLTETSLGQIYKAIPLEGEPVLQYLIVLDKEILATSEAATLFLAHSQKWKELRDLYTLNLLESGQEGNDLYYTFEYTQGRLLSDVLDKCMTEGLPLATDQAVYLAERAAGALVSLSTQGIFAGHLSPEQILITFEGEVKILPCVLRDLQTTPVLALDIIRETLKYLPEKQRKGMPAKGSTDRYALGTLLFEFLCREPFFTGAEDFQAQARLEENLQAEGLAEAIPENLMAVLKRAILRDQPDSYADLDSLKAGLDKLITSGEYSPTTFNMAFLMHSLFRGEDDEETKKDEGFFALDREPFKPTPPEPEPEEVAEASARARVEAPARELDETFGVEPPRSKRGLFIGLGALAIIIVIGVLAWLAFMGPKGPTEAEIQAQVDAKVTEERTRLQERETQISAQLQQAEQEKQELEQQLSNAQTEDERLAAQQRLQETQARLDEQRRQREALQRESASLQPTPPPATETTQPPTEKPAETEAPPAAAVTPKPAPPPPAAPPQPEAKPLQEGDFVEGWALDVKPHLKRDLQVQLTPIAKKNRISGQVFVEASIDHNGRVTQAKVLRSLPMPDYGTNEAVRQAVLNSEYSPGIKDGIRVSTKLTFPLSIR
jgi:TonB family protein